MGRDPQAAGARFERRIASDLRTALGEGWTVTRNQTNRQKGQQPGVAGEFAIDGPSPFPWCIECKDGGGFRVEHLFGRPAPGPLATTSSREGYCAQAIRQAATVGRRPLLVVREPGARLVFAMELAGSAVQPPGAVVRVDGELWGVSRWDDFTDVLAAVRGQNFG